MVAFARSRAQHINVACCVLLACLSSATATLTDRAALELFYMNCNGDSWKNSTHWLDPNVTICDWFGVDCSDARTEYKVDRLRLQDNNIVCSLPVDLFYMSELKWLDLRQNNGLTADFTALNANKTANLQVLTLSDTNLESLEGVDAFAKSLTTLFVSGCAIGGPFPEDVLSLAALKHMDMSYNFLIGILPEGLSTFSNLRTCILSHNFFSGQIPKSIGNLRKLNNFQLQFNMLSGALPASLGDMYSLTYLSLSNQVQGTGDSQVGGLTGPLVDFAQLMFLYNVDLSNNMLSGSIPPTMLASLFTEFGDFIVLDLRSNKLTGTLPESLSRFQSMRVYVADNQIDTIPATLCQQSNWLFGQVGQFGCDAIVCPPGTYNGFGRQISTGFPCLLCASDLPVFGQTSCEPSTVVQITNVTPPLERLSTGDSYHPLSEVTPKDTHDVSSGEQVAVALGSLTTFVIAALWFTC